MTKRMLINATQPEEIRVAMVDGQSLYDLDIEIPGKEQKKGNIYKGIVTHVEASLDAAFVNYGAERHGFLPLKEVAPEYFNSVDANGQSSQNGSLREGQEIIVQVEKEERGNKGAALTTYISLAGSFIVLMPNNPKAGGVSRRIEGDDRQEMRDILDALQIPEHMGTIIRTAGLGRNKEELDWDLSILLNLWSAIQSAAGTRSAPFLIHQESSMIFRAVRDHLRSDIAEVMIDNPALFDQLKEHMALIRPDFSTHVKLYTDTVPLFSRYQVESQIESAYQREVRLPSGGALVIDHTEALIAIDINSARATKGGDIEETAFLTNLEAAEEIARQCRLRDLGGLIVIDFIDMQNPRNKREVEQRLKDSVKMDRARVQIGHISRFGLAEMSRQRLRTSFEESFHQTCPRCMGAGSIRSVESCALQLLRLIEEEAMKPQTAQVQAQTPVEVATFLLNEKRKAILDLEQRHKVHVLMIPNPHLSTPHYRIERIKMSESEGTSSQTSYKVVTPPEPTVHQPSTVKPMEAATPAIRAVAANAARVGVHKETGMIRRLWSSLFGATAPAASRPEYVVENPAQKPQNRHKRQRRDNPQGGNAPERQQRQGQGAQRNNGNGGNNRTRNNTQRRQQQRNNPQQGRTQNQRQQTQAAPVTSTPVEATAVTPVVEIMPPTHTTVEASAVVTSTPEKQPGGTTRYPRRSNYNRRSSRRQHTDQKTRQDGETAAVEPTQEREPGLDPFFSKAEEMDGNK